MEKFQESPEVFDRVHPGGCQGGATEEEAYPVKAGDIIRSLKNHGTLLDCCVNDSCALQLA